MQFTLLKVFLVVSVFALPNLASGQEGNLEIPGPGSSQTGVGSLSGWKCTAGTLTARFDSGEPMQVLYGIVRGDTKTVCGDIENGFVLPGNWNSLGAGEHVVEVFDDGVLFARASFSVFTFGEEFVDGASATIIVPNFPRPGQSVLLQWQEADQRFVPIKRFPGPENPTIEFTHVPPYRSFENLTGRVSGANPNSHRVAVVIRVRGRWWTKPYWSSPLTVLKSDGTFTCDITTGGVDEEATVIAAYLVPVEYDPPLLAGDSTLPAELDQNSVAKVVATRAS